MARGKKSQVSKFFVWIILILLMIGLVGFGASGLSGTIRTIGTVGDTPIDLNQYARELNNEMQTLEAQTGQNFGIVEAQQFGLDQLVLQRLINAASLENESTRIGLSVGDEKIREQVLGTQAFLGVDGSFDREAYEFTLERNNLTPSDYEDGLRADISSSILQSSIASGLKTSGTFADRLINYVGEQRSFSWIELDESALETPLSEPSDADLRAYYDANQEQFMLPETKQLTYVLLSPEDIIDAIEVDEDILRQAYQDRISEFQVPERRLVERLVFSAQDEAAVALAAITTGETTFDAIVAERGLELSDIDLGDVTKTDLGDAGDAVFELDGTGLVGPVETGLGPALIRVNAVLSAENTSFEMARSELSGEVASDTARRQIGDLITDIDDLLAGGASLEELATETEMQLGKLEWFEGTDEGVAAYEAFTAAASAVGSQDFPEVIELDDGGIFALRVDEVTPVRPEPFEEAQASVAQAWEIEETRAQLNLQAQTLVAELDNGVTISGLGFATAVETNITRDTFIEGTVAQFIEAVFALGLDETAVVDNGANVLIAKLDAITPPSEDDAGAAALRAQVQESATQAIGQDVLEAFTRSMQTQVGISIDQNAINAVHAQFR